MNTKSVPMKTSQQGINLIAHFEQYHDGDSTKIGLQPKMCPAGVWTVGLGHALINKNTGKWLKGHGDYPLVRKQYPELMDLTKKQADAILQTDLVEYENKVNRGLKVTVQQHQFDALVSFCYNCGWSDTLFRLINQRSPMATITDWWQTHYISANGVKMKGLIRRRKSEAYLFETGKINYFGL